MEKEIDAVWREISGFRNERELKKFLKSCTNEAASAWLHDFNNRFQQHMTETLADIKSCQTRIAESECAIHKMLGGTMH